MNVSSIKSVAASALLMVSFAAPAAAYDFQNQVAEAPNSSSDPLLSASTIGDTVQSVIKDRLRAGGAANGTVVLDGHQLLVSGPNVRVVTLRLSLYRDVVVDRKKASVSTCALSSHFWRAGPSERAHVASILDDVQGFAQQFKTKCL